jgi:hypothetical protein
MPPKQLKISDNGQVSLLIEPSGYKAKPKPIDNSFVYRYQDLRELSINDESANQYFMNHYNMTRDKFNELSEADQLKMLGVRSGKTAKIITETQDALNRQSRHAEMTLQATFCKWVTTNYPNIKFIHHEREGKRGNFKQNQNKVLNTAGSMPDWETTQTTERYSGLLIEFKRPGEDWLLKSGYVKPKYVHQYECHMALWLQRKVVYFCNDLEIAKMILQQYLEGRTMRQRFYKVKGNI